MAHVDKEEKENDASRSEQETNDRETFYLEFHFGIHALRIAQLRSRSKWKVNGQFLELFVMVFVEKRQQYAQSIKLTLK